MHKVYDTAADALDGLLFVWEEDPGPINAGKQTITEMARTSRFDSARSFGSIRGGKIAAVILQAVEVVETAIPASWSRAWAERWT